jgi:hypothetical protein
MMYAMELIVHVLLHNCVYVFAKGGKGGPGSNRKKRKKKEGEHEAQP